MNAKTLIGTVVGLAVAVILAATFMMPVLNDATTTSATLKNEGAFYVEADPTDTYTITYDLSSNRGVLVVNGEEIETPFGGYSVLILDSSVLRAESTDYTLQYRGDGQSIAGINVLDLTIANGEVTGTYRLKWDSDSTADRTWPTTTYTSAYVVSPTEQDLVMSEYTNPVYMNADSEIFAFGQSTVSSTNVLVKIEGTIEDNVTITVMDRTTGVELEDYTISNLVINAEAEDKYVDIYSLSSITFTVTLSDESTADLSFSAYVVPAEVSSELSQHLNSSEITLVNTIPVLVIISIVIASIGMLANRRD